MRFKYLVSLLTIAAGLTISPKATLADVVVKWQAGDNSANIQKAIDSGDSKVIIPKAAQPWIVGKPIYARKPNQKIIFKPEVVLQAQKGAFHHIYQSMFNIQADNVTLSGYNATFKMQKADYANPNLYKKSEWRHNINVWGSKNFVIEGLTLRDSGGDGIIVSHDPRYKDKNGIPTKRFASGTIRDIKAINNYRQGISITSAKDLLVENSVFRDTGNTNPSSGVDLEPDHDWQKLVNIKFRNTNFINNQGNGIQIGIWKYRGSKVEDISISFDGCKSTGSGRFGIKVNGIDDGFYNGPKGNISFKNCEITTSKQHGIYIRNDQKNPAQTFTTTFENTKVVNTATNSTGFYPVILMNTHEPGGLPNVDFGDNFVITDNKSRPGVFAHPMTQRDGLTNVHGTVAIKNPNKKPTVLGNKLSNVTLKFTN